MAGKTATIRVTRETRDLLARRAREEGVSLLAMLAEFAREVTREAAFRSERDPSRADAVRGEAPDEEGDWEAALQDGVD